MSSSSTRFAIGELMTKKYWIAALPAFVAGLSCSGEGFEQDFDFEAQEQELKFMPKPGTPTLAGATEAGLDVAQVGVYTFYGADADRGPTGQYTGSAHLFKDNAPFRSYQARSHDGSRMGRYIDLSDNWAVTGLSAFPVSPGVVTDAVMLIGKSGGDFASCGSISSNGTLPNCVTCSGSLSNNNMSCTPAVSGIHIVAPPPGNYSFANPVFELAGNELTIGNHNGGDYVYHYRYSGSQWVNSSIIPVPNTTETFGHAIAVSGNLMAVSAGVSASPTHVYVYSRASSTSPWQLRLRIDPPTGRGITRFGERLDLSGTTLLVGAAPYNAHFIELAPQNFSTPSTALGQSCALFTSTTQSLVSDVAVSGNRAVVTTDNMPYTFSRGTNWTFYGGLPSGIFPHDAGVLSTNLKAADVDDNRATIGWTTYHGTSSYARGGAVGFTFDEYDCGVQTGLPGSGLVRAKLVSAAGASAPSISGYPASLALDGNSTTRWMATANGGTRFELDLGEFRALSHLELAWGVRYAHDYLVEVSDDLDSVPASQRVWRWATHITGGDGNGDFINFRTASESFARRVRITMNGFATQPGQSDQGVSLKEVRVYSKVHNACGNKPVLNCTTAKATASAP